MVLKPRIEIEIGELVMHGFGRADGLAAARAFGAELERLARTADANVTPGGAPLLRVEAPPPARPGPAATGAAAAAAVFRGLAR